MNQPRKPSGEEIVAWVQHGLALMKAAGINIPSELILRERPPRYERPLTIEQERIREQVDRFVGSVLVSSPGAPPVQAQRIYEAYRCYATDEQTVPVSQTAFGRALTRHVRKEKLGGRTYYLDVEIPDAQGLLL
jgi:hypothetical protein